MNSIFDDPTKAPPDTISITYTGEGGPDHPYELLIADETGAIGCYLTHGDLMRLASEANDNLRLGEGLEPVEGTVDNVRAGDFINGFELEDVYPLPDARVIVFICKDDVSIVVSPGQELNQPGGVRVLRRIE